MAQEGKDNAELIESPRDNKQAFPLKDAAGTFRPIESPTYSPQQTDADKRSLSLAREELSRIRSELENSGSEHLRGVAASLSVDKLKPSLYGAVPMIASVIAHRNNPDIPLLSPTKEDVYQMNPIIKMLAEMIKFFSIKLGHHFDTFVEKKATSKVDTIGAKLASTVDSIKQIPNPKEQFVSELTDMYRGIAGADAPKKELRAFMRTMNHFQVKGVDQDFMQQYPLLGSTISRIRTPVSAYASRATVAMPEILKGIEVFLKKQGVKDIPEAPESSGGMKRFLAKKFASKKLEHVKQEMPEVLTTLTHILPDNGRKFADRVYDTTEDVVNLRKQGMSNHEIGKFVATSAKSALE